MIILTLLFPKMPLWYLPQAKQVAETIFWSVYTKFLFHWSILNHKCTSLLLCNFIHSIFNRKHILIITFKPNNSSFSLTILNFCYIKVKIIFQTSFITSPKMLSYTTILPAAIKENTRIKWQPLPCLRNI